MGQDFTVTITDPRRAEEIKRVLGTATVHVKSPFPERANLPGKPESLVYMLDLELITDEQRSSLVEYIADKFQLTLDQVTAELDQQGVPILAEHCVVSIEHPQKWF